MHSGSSTCFTLASLDTIGGWFVEPTCLRPCDVITRFNSSTYLRNSAQTAERCSLTALCQLSRCCCPRVMTCSSSSAFCSGNRSAEDVVGVECLGTRHDIISSGSPSRACCCCCCAARNCRASSRIWLICDTPNCFCCCSPFFITLIATSPWLRAAATCHTVRYTAALSKISAE